MERDDPASPDSIRIFDISVKHVHVVIDHQVVIVATGADPTGWAARRLRLSEQASLSLS